MTTLQQYLRENIFCRCEHLVLRLVASNLLPQHEIFPGEYEIPEWWLVSRDLASRLRAAEQPVLGFTELHIWGRSATGLPFEDDIDLIAAIGSLPPSEGPHARP